MYPILTGRCKTVLEFPCLLDRALLHSPGEPGNYSLAVSTSQVMNKHESPSKL